MDILKFLQTVKGSKQYEFEGSVLTITNYRTGERVRLDLAKMDEDMLEALTPDDDEEEEW